jgi:hypothetical protein
VLHIRCGDDLREKLPLAGFSGGYLSYPDPICQGPLPDLPADELVAARASFISEAYGFPHGDVLARLRAEETGLNCALDADRVVLWFSQDRYDQLLLVRVLARLADDARSAQPGRLALISIDRFPGVARFVGLGQLTPAQLSTLVGQEAPVSAAQLDLARQAWSALRASSPTPVQALVDGGASALPFLAAALHRHLRDLPWTTDGLSLTERLCLDAVTGGARTLEEVFVAVQAADDELGFGDLQLLPPLRTLTRHGLVEPIADGWAPTGAGGVQNSDLPGWRWDPDRGRVVDVNVVRPVRELTVGRSRRRPDNDRLHGR